VHPGQATARGGDLGEPIALRRRTGAAAGRGRRAGLAAIGLALACAQASGSPESAARAFWSALERGDASAAQAISTAPSASRIEALFGSREIESVAFVRTLASDDAAIVETALTMPGEHPPVAFQTHLVRADGAWRVDAEATAEALRRAAFASALGEVQEGLREGQRVVSEALEQGAREASEALRQAVEDADRALGNAPPEEEPPAPEEP
jgi:hypothetical protein